MAHIPSLISTLSNMITDENELQAIKEWLNTKPELRVMVTGKTGAGKSTLLNGLLGEEIFKEGENLDRETMEVIMKRKLMMDSGVTIIACDSPGLQDGTDDEDAYLRDMQDKTRDGLDLVLYCISMSNLRSDLRVHDSAINKLTRAFGIEFWEKVVFILTFANSYLHHLEDNGLSGEILEDAFHKQINRWEEKIKAALSHAGVQNESISIHVAGAPKVPSLPGHQFWMSDLWANIYVAVKQNAKPVYLRLACNRIQEKGETNEDDFEKPMKEQPIVCTEAVERLVIKDIEKEVNCRAQISELESVADPVRPQYSETQTLIAAIMQLTLNDPRTIRVTQRITASVLVIYGAYLLYRSFSTSR